MSKTDVARWSDWRTNQKRPLRAPRRCSCGNRFYPDIEKQMTCRPCCGLAEKAERAPVTADEAERQNLDRLLLEALADQAAYKPIALADPPSDQEKLWRKASKRKGRQVMPHRTAGKPARGMTKHMAKAALKCARSGMSVRKISKRFNVDQQVIRDWAILTADDMRFRAACEGLYGSPDCEQPAPAVQGDVYWTDAQHESRCPQCRSRIFVGEQISRPEAGRWMHAACAQAMGYEVLNRDGSVALVEVP